jgi:hypothetical protein
MVTGGSTQRADRATLSQIATEPEFFPFLNLNQHLDTSLVLEITVSARSIPASCARLDPKNPPQRRRGTETCTPITCIRSFLLSLCLSVSVATTIIGRSTQAWCARSNQRAQLRRGWLATSRRARPGSQADRRLCTGCAVRRQSGDRLLPVRRAG